MESILGNIQVEFDRSRRSAATITTLILASLATLFCFGNGQHLIGALAPMVLGNNMLIGGLAEILLLLYLAKSIKSAPIWQRHRLTFHALRTLIPLILFTILTGSILSELNAPATLATALRWSWLASALLLSALFSLRPSASLAPAVN